MRAYPNRYVQRTHGQIIAIALMYARVLQITHNPPWIKLEWNEQAVLGDRQPLFAVKKFTATQTTKVRAEELKSSETYTLYFNEYAWRDYHQVLNSSSVKS